MISSLVFRSNHNRTSSIFLAAVVIAAASAALGQTDASAGHQSRIETVQPWEHKAGGKLSFDVASIRMINSDASWSGSNIEVNALDKFVPTGGFFKSKNSLLLDIIFAYKIIDSSQYESLISQLPKWARTSSYIIEA